MARRKRREIEVVKMKLNIARDNYYKACERWQQDDTYAAFRCITDAERKLNYARLMLKKARKP